MEKTTVTLSFNVRREETWEVPSDLVPTLIEQLHGGLGQDWSSSHAVERTVLAGLSDDRRCKWEFDLEDPDLRVEIEDSIWLMNDGIYEGPEDDGEGEVQA